MFKAFSTVILLLVLMPVNVSFAQSKDDYGSSKIYSGYLHQHQDKIKGSLWHTLFGNKASKQNKQDAPDSQCTIEFKSPISFAHQMVAQLPEELSYFIKFNNGYFKKFIIKIYTNDDEEYTIDPDAEGKQVGINDEHHIFDSYLIYLILGQDIDHLEVVGPSEDDKDKYILDKLEIRNDD